VSERATRAGVGGRRAGVAAGAWLIVAACAPAAPVVPGPLPAASVLASVAASAPLPEQTPDAEFRQRPPPGAGEGGFSAPIPFDQVLPNGLRVLFLENHTTPLVAMQLVVSRGAAAAAPGVAALAASMLVRGSKTRSADALGDAFDAFGTTPAVHVDDDSISLAATVTSADAPRALELLADALEHPTFPAEELADIRSRRLSTLAEEDDQPRSLLRKAVAEAVYPSEHPYAWPSLLDEARLSRITRADLVRFHRENVAPDSVTLAVAGDLSREALIEVVKRALGGWKGRAAPRPVIRAPRLARVRGKEVSHSPRVLLVDLPGATQTSLALADVGAPRTSPDHDALLVLNTILGRRLGANLRQRHAYTYGATSGFAFRHGPGPFTAGGEIVREKTAEAIREALGEVERLREETLTLGEVIDARVLLGALSGRFETMASSAASLALLGLHGLGSDDFLTLRVRLQMVTPEEVHRVAQAYLRPDRLKIVLVGDAATIEPGVRALDLGEVQVKKLVARGRRRPAPSAPPPED
jgi:predicted Zn-dependent peptidase